METEKLNVLVIGDIMLDEYIIGDVNRISPEAPVPIVLVTEKKYCLGGCGNVLNNLRALNVNTTCISTIGKDLEGAKIFSLLNEICVNTSFIIKHPIPTTIKTRIVTENKIQMLRIDREITNYPEFLKNKIINNIVSCLTINTFNVIIISDYNKGGFFELIINTIIKYSKDSIIIADIKPENIKYLNNHIYLLKPNEKEYLKIKSFPYSHPKYILNTLGKKGMVLYDILDNVIQTIKSKPVEVYNVSGAGDTVMAVLATCIGLNLDIQTSTYIANECGRYVVQYPGTTPIDCTFFLTLLEDKTLMDKVNATLS